MSGAPSMSGNRIGARHNNTSDVQSAHAADTPFRKGRRSHAPASTAAHDIVQQTPPKRPRGRPRRSLEDLALARDPAQPVVVLPRLRRNVPLLGGDLYWWDRQLPKYVDESGGYVTIYPPPQKRLLREINSVLATALTDENTVTLQTPQEGSSGRIQPRDQLLQDTIRFAQHADSNAPRGVPKWARYVHADSELRHEIRQQRRIRRSAQQTIRTRVEAAWEARQQWVRRDNRGPAVNTCST